MDMLDFGSPRQTYDIRVEYSLLYECALGIGAFTWDEVHDKLDIGQAQVLQIKRQMSEALRREVSLAGLHHTWRSVLFLIHRCPYLPSTTQEKHLPVFMDWLKEIKDSIRTEAAPYLGASYQAPLAAALAGNALDMQKLLDEHHENPVIYQNLQYLFAVSAEQLLDHIKRLVEGWYEEVVSRDRNVVATLEQSAAQTSALSQNVSHEKLIHTVTRGGEFVAEPGVTTLWLIPQVSYRPFTIRNHLPGYAVYYYPVDPDAQTGLDKNRLISNIAAKHKAVGDVLRVRLLELLAASSRSLAELAQAIGASKPSTHHHLLLLRTAGLVHVDGGVYGLNVDEVLALGEELCRLLKLDGVKAAQETSQGR